MHVSPADTVDAIPMVDDWMGCMSSQRPVKANPRRAQVLGKGPCSHVFLGRGLQTVRICQETEQRNDSDSFEICSVFQWSQVQGSSVDDLTTIKKN